MKLIIFFLLLSSVAYSQIYSVNKPQKKDSMTYAQLKEIVLSNEKKIDGDIVRHIEAGEYYKAARNQTLISSALIIVGSAVFMYDVNRIASGEQAGAGKPLGGFMMVAGVLLDINVIGLYIRGNKILYYRDI